MEKKFKFSDKSQASKVIYLTVIAILCVSAIVIGIVAGNNRKKTDDNTPPDSTGNSDSTDIGDGSTDGDGSDETPPSGSEEDEKKPEPIFVSPTVGTVIKSHSTTVPVFSNTLDEWRIHTGLDVMAELGAEVVASSDGEVTGVYNDPMLGMTVEITHGEKYKTRYSGLAKDGIEVEVGDIVSGGDTLGLIGDTTVIELADEPHLHFELSVEDALVNPLDYITEESKLESLGIKSGNA